jgi:hypothetical protein
MVYWILHYAKKRRTTPIMKTITPAVINPAAISNPPNNAAHPPMNKSNNERPMILTVTMTMNAALTRLLFDDIIVPSYPIPR